MKKKFLKVLIVFSFLFCLSNVDANECVHISSSGSSGVSVGNYKYKYWDKKTWTEVVQGSRIKSSTSNYGSAQAAISACGQRFDVRRGKAKCDGTYTVYGTKYVCNGRSYSTQGACRNATYASSSNKCRSKNFNCVKRSGIHLIAPYECPTNKKVTGKYDACTSKCYGYTCSRSGGQYSSNTCGGKCNVKCSSNSSYCRSSTNYNKVTYGYYYRSVSSIEKSQASLKDGFGSLNIFEYKTDGGDRTYCIQPGKQGPGGNEYCLNEVFDLHRCKTENHYFCGLADILYQTVKEDGTYADGSVKFVDNGEYDFSEITTALRMWVAYAAQGKLALGDGEVITGIEDASLDYVSNTNVYLNTANMVANGYNGLGCSGVGLGVLCGENARYIKAIQLFKNALNSGHEFIKYESDKAGEPEITDTSSTEGGEVTFNVVAKLPETYQEKMVDCTKAELLNKKSGCKVYIELKDKNGKVVNGQIEDAKCEGKESCEFIVKIQRKECSKTGGNVYAPDKYTLNIGLKGYEKGGYVRQYVNAAGAEVSQVMMTFAFNEKRNEVEGDPDKKDFTLTIPYELPVPCYCDPAKYCDDFKARGNLKNTCEGYGTLGAGAYDTYEKSSYEDPYMNCILNACDPSKKEEFSYTKETGANDKVCNIYCRKELTFYLANKTKVYAGMQFSYDIASKVLQGEGDIEKVLTTDHKLTSIVLQKRQCTSEIYYNKKNKNGKTWIEQYDSAVKNMINAYNEWKKIEVLYDWEVDNGGPHVITACAKNSYTSTATRCGSHACRTNVGTCGEKTIYTWPSYGYSCYSSGSDTITSKSKRYNTWKINSSCKSNSKGEVKCVNSKAGVPSNTLQSGSPNTGVSGCGSTSCCTSYTCRCGNGRSCGPKSSPGCTPRRDSMNCCCNSSRSTSTSCTNGSDQSNATLKDEENIAWLNFKSAVKAVEQLYYDLQNCNFYVDSSENRAKFSEKVNYYYTDLKGEHHPGDTTVSPSKTVSGSIKDYLLEQAYCKTKEECVSLVLGYEDDYGVETEFGSNVDNVPSRLNNNYYCKNDGNKTKCYEYKQDVEVEIENTNKVAKHDRIVCSGVGTNATCKSVDIYLPTNDYATFITVTEADFWQPKSYKTSVYTGVVSEDDGSTGASNSTPLGKEVFPVSNKARKDESGRDKGSTGSYYVKHKYSNLGLTTNEKFDYEYACSYDVYNTTKYYDCQTNENGVTDLTKCKNPCYELKDGVPVITDSCNIWTPKDNNSKSYGFIYRNVDVGNLFPGKDIRDTGINWSSKTDVIDAIEKTADTIYTTDDYLEYRYVLTPSNIRQIREYNSSQNANGGYLNETLENCTMVDDDGGLKSFTECKSSFLSEIKAGRFGDIKVSGSKS